MNNAQNTKTANPIKGFLCCKVITTLSRFSHKGSKIDLVSCFINTIGDDNHSLSPTTFLSLDSFPASRSLPACRDPL